MSDEILGEPLETDTLLSLSVPQDPIPDMLDADPAKSYIDGLFKKRTVNLICGGSGSGKTTLGFQIYKALTSLSHNEFLGRTSNNKAAWAYISADRAVDEVKETQERMGVEFPVFSCIDMDMVGKALVGEIIPRLPKFYGYRPNFIYIDSFHTFFRGKPFDNIEVALWLTGLAAYCKKKNITILGAVHSAKEKIGMGYAAPREKISGGAAWGGFTATILTLEMAGKPGDGKRKLTILTRNAPDEVINLEFDSMGWLIPAADSLEVEGTKFLMGIIVGKIAPGTNINYSELWARAKDKGMTKPTFDRHLRKLCKEKILTRIQKGLYKKS